MILPGHTLKSESTSTHTSTPEAAALGDPWEVARRLAHEPDLVFFDSALARPGAVSVIAAGAERVIEGETAADWEALGRTLAGLEGAPGMAAGFVEYEGRFRFGIYPRVLRYAHDERRWTGELPGPLGEPAAREEGPIPFAAEMEREQFEGMVRRAQEYIAAGDIYQVNLSHRFSAPWAGGREEALGMYGRLRACSPAPYAAWIGTPGGAILSSSPEEFLRLEGRRIVTRPIKGTRTRGADRQGDERAARELRASAKERAELIMITDLERNDLGQVCEYGSVQASELLRLEQFSQVFHLVSTVEGWLRAGIDHVSALRACFPGGSITGAPKKRAREIIAELEPCARGLYTGAIGYFGFDGSSRFNIAIRTAILEEGRAHFGVGAGIVADSEPAREWEETLHKAAGLLQAAGR